MTKKLQTETTNKDTTDFQKYEEASLNNNDTFFQTKN